ncbi:hypothetical protein JNW88_21455 [Micromonospora sp. ATA32]|nr:hypothetical protein [Micromonospora sp. ATA32]
MRACWRNLSRSPLAEPLRADEMLTLTVNAVSAAHRELARRLRIDLPG